MPAPDYDEALLSEVQLTCERGHWRVFVRYDGQRYGVWFSDIESSRGTRHRVHS